MSTRGHGGKLQKPSPHRDEIDRQHSKSSGKAQPVPKTDAVSKPPVDSRLVSLRHHPSLWVGVSALLLFALFPWPYGYYVLLRLAVFVVSAWIAYEQWKIDNAISGWVVAFGAVALLYNPLLPVHLTRELWIVLNLATAALFLWHFRELKRLGPDCQKGNNATVSARSAEEPEFYTSISRRYGFSATPDSFPALPTGTKAPT